jgi:hypothetical protein
LVLIAGGDLIEGVGLPSYPGARPACGVWSCTQGDSWLCRYALRGWVRERSRVWQWSLASVLAAAVCRSEFTVMPGGHGGWESDSQAGTGAFRGNHYRFRQAADRGAGVGPQSGQAYASGDSLEQLKLSCGQGPIVMRLADGGAHDAEPVARVVD